MNLVNAIPEKYRFSWLRKAQSLSNLFVSQLRLMQFAVETARDHTLAFKMLEADLHLINEIHAALLTHHYRWSIFDINAPTEDQFLDMRADLQAISPEYTKSGYVFLHTGMRLVLFLHSQPGITRCLPLIFQHRGGATTLFKIIVGAPAGRLPAISTTMRDMVLERFLVLGNKPSHDASVSMEKLVAGSGMVREKKWQIGGVMLDSPYATSDKDTDGPQ